MKPIQAIVVDDEPLARSRLEDLLAHLPEITLIKSCSNGLEAVEAINQREPDLVFLDVQMPGIDGFGVLDRLNYLPAIIFVTAYDQYALQAFDVHAVDYLLKPFDASRFQQAIERATVKIRQSQQADLLALIETLQKDKKATQRITVKSEGRVLFLDLEIVTWIESAGNYVHIHTEDGKQYAVRETMKKLEERFADVSDFVRIHRSLMVNQQAVQSLEPWGTGEYWITLHDGTRLNSSRQYRDVVMRLIEENL